jgi:hypothetical protein
MKRYFCAILLSFCCLIYLNGQEYPAGLVGEINGDFYIWEARAQKPGKLFSTFDHFLLRFDPSMRLITRAKIGISPSPDEQLEKVMLIGKRIVILTATFSSKAEKQILYYQFIDLLTLAKQGQKTMLIESPVPKGRLANLALFKYFLSEDGARLLITREYVPKFLKATPKTFGISVFDQDLNLQWNKSETLPLTDKEFKPAFYQVSTNGDVTITGTAKYDKDTVETKLLRNYVLLEYTDKGQKYSMRKLGLEVANFKIIGSRTTHLSDKIIAAGFFKIPDVKRQYGYFLQEYNLESLKKEKDYYKTLAQETDVTGETDADTDPELKKLDKAGGDDRFAFIIDRFRIDQSGNIFLIGEQNNTFYYTNQYGTTVTEYYLDIYVLKLDPEGKLIWEIRIPKKQIYSPTATKNTKYLGNFVSYATCLFNDNLIFFINDNPENLDIGNRKPKSVKWKESQGQVVIVDKNGKMQRRLISDIPGNMFYTGFLYNLSGNRILIRYAAFKEYEESTYKILDLDQIL